MGLQVEGTASTHAGIVRSNNEDNYYLFGNYRYDTGLKIKRDTKTVCAQQMSAAVFDGMGGEEAGEIASLLAARTFMPCALEQMREEAVRQMLTANEEICTEMRRRGGVRMGTTAAALYLDKDTAVCANVGDSRCYFMRNGTLRLLSVDHSEARQMVDMGVLTPEKARQSKSWHKLTQHLGIFPEEFVIEPHISAPIALQPGDIFLLCSDGLTDMVMDDEIAGILNRAKHTGEMADALIEAALAHGGKDNVTALVLQIKDDTSAKGQGKNGLQSKALAGAGVLLLLLLAVAAAILFSVKGEKTGQTVLAMGDNRIEIDNSFLFSGEDTALSEDGKAYLDAVLELYEALNDTEVLISAEEAPKEETERELSEARMEAVRAYCLETCPELADDIEIIK